MPPAGARVRAVSRTVRHRIYWRASPLKCSELTIFVDAWVLASESLEKVFGRDIRFPL